MTFNRGSKIDSGKVSKRGRNAAIGGGSAVVVVGLILLVIGQVVFTRLENKIPERL